MTDEEVVAELTISGMAIGDHFLVGGLICSVNSRGELMGNRIDDPGFAAAAKRYLRRAGVREYASIQDFNNTRE